MVDMSTSLSSAPRQDSGALQKCIGRDWRGELCSVGVPGVADLRQGRLQRTRMGILSTRRECRVEFHERSVPFGRLSAHSSPRNHSSQAIHDRSDMLFCLVPR